MRGQELQDVEWNTVRGPFGNNPDFDAELAPPLAPDWSVKLPRPFEFGDGLRVGSGDSMHVTVGYTGMHSYDTRTGALLGEFDGCRAEEERDYLYFASGRAWIAGMEAGYSYRRRLVSVIRLSPARLAQVGFPRTTIHGVVACGGSRRFCCETGLLDPDESPQIERFADGFRAHVAVGPHVYGRLPAANKLHSNGLACLDADTGAFRWIAAPGTVRARAITLVSERYCVVLEGPNDKSVALLSAVDGSELWSVPYRRGAGEDDLIDYGDPKLSGVTIDRDRRPEVTSCFLVADRLSRVFYVEETHLRCRDADTGEELWRFELPCEPQTRHLIGTGRFLWFAMVESEKRKGRLYCFDKVSGEVVWTKNLPARLRSVYMSLIGGRLQLVVGTKLCSLRSEES